MIKVAVVEDDERIRRVVMEVLADAEGFQGVGSFRNGASAIAELPKLRPDIILMDINLPDFSGVECVTRLAPELPESQILMLTVYQDPETIFDALSAGAHGYLVKPVMPDKLIEALKEVRAGGVPMSRSIARKVVEAFRRPGLVAPKALATQEAGLGPRELQVLEQLVQGLSYKEIAGELEIAVSTVSTYVQRIYEKLHVRTRREIIARYKS